MLIAVIGSQLILFKRNVIILAHIRYERIDSQGTFHTEWEKD